MEQGSPQTAASLIVTADDYGYDPAYDRGILEVARAGAIDAASAMVLRPGCEPGPLQETGVEVGLHLELPEAAATGGPGGEGETEAALAAQLEAFERLFGRPPAYLDGHHHCHARGARAAAIARVAATWGLPVRSVDGPHRELLRRLGVATPDLLVGRLGEEEPAVPPEVRALLDGAPAHGGVIEWMVHPGHRAARGSSYDVAREEDLALLLSLHEEGRLRALRTGHAALVAA